MNDDGGIFMMVSFSNTHTHTQKWSHTSFTSVVVVVAVVVFFVSPRPLRRNGTRRGVPDWDWFWKMKKKESVADSNCFTNKKRAATSFGRRRFAWPVSLIFHWSLATVSDLATPTPTPDWVAQQMTQKWSQRSLETALRSSFINRNETRPTSDSFLHFILQLPWEAVWPHAKKKPKRRLEKTKTASSGTTRPLPSFSPGARTFLKDPLEIKQLKRFDKTGSGWIVSSQVDLGSTRLDWVWSF